MDIRHTHRIFVSQRLEEGASVRVEEDLAHYLLHVLRLGNGDALRLFNGKDGEFKGSVERAGKNKALVHIGAQTRPQEAGVDVWLCCAPIKKAHFDYMIEKATELGVSEIQPILTQRTQVREVNGDRAWTLCKEAAEQSDRLDIPAVGNPVKLDDLIGVFPKDRALIVCAEWGEAAPIHKALHSEAIQKFEKAAIVTGPEGGFAAEELELLRKAPNTFFVRLGPRILRADTAAIAALACWQAIKGDWGKA
ncbi:MAG: 16S rRNA (uracil(1498)-N(3))-methyltransferase [Alphaproteobacteria bacterium]|nr:16S rRNA (uracil(1498)-N(3))-methyltransferase [Alphaproteobacteria bacterium]